MQVSNELYIFLIVASCVSLIISGIGTIIGLMALAKVIGVEKSTHTVQLTPVDPEIDAHNQKLIKDWATSEAELDKQRKMSKEELEDKMPEFYKDEDEIISF
jgi:hypothetical protein